MVDFIAIVVALLCLWAIHAPSVPTGILGSAGLALIGCAALVAIDDSSFANVRRLDYIVMALLVGFLAIFVHVVLMHWRSSTGRFTRRRRSTDWTPFDAEDTRPMERA